MLGAAVLWGTTGTAATFAPEVSPLAIGAAAMGLGGLLQTLMALVQIRNDRSRLLDHWIYVLIGAVAVAIYPLAFYTSMHMAGVTVGTVITIGAAPLLSAVIERVFDSKPLTQRWMVGTCLGIIGAIMLCIAKSKGHTDSAVNASAFESVVGVFLGLLAAATYALYSWTAHRLMRHNIASSAAMGATFGIGGLLLMPVLLMTGSTLLATWTNAAVGVYMVLVPMFLGYVLFGLGLARIPASMATTLSLIEPVVAAVLAVIIVGERLPVLGWLGVALIIACLYVLTSRTETVQKQSHPQNSFNKG
ncbi:EamA family transporter [Pseudomonas sp. MAG002Y]|nr:EamA family transporter [Pseudomonas sp. MAG002Y]